jgi:hypothetical protein
MIIHKIKRIKNGIHIRNDLLRMKNELQHGILKVTRGIVCSYT